MAGRGFNEQNVGVVERRNGVKLFYPPSAAAEAVVGRMRRAEVKLALDGFLTSYDENPQQASEEFPVLSKWAAMGKGVISFADLEERVRSHFEGQSKLIDANSIKEHRVSGAGVDYFVIRRRGDERGERSRGLRLVVNEKGEVIDYNCSCWQFNTSGARGNFEGAEPFIVKLACYHVSSALAERGIEHYDLGDTSLVLENLARRVYLKSEDKSFIRDMAL